MLLIDAERPLEHQDLRSATSSTQEGRALVIARQQMGPGRGQADDAQGAARDARRSACRRCRAWRWCRSRRSTGQGLDRLCRAILDAHECGTGAFPTAELNRWLHEAHRAPSAAGASRGRRIKIRYMTQPRRGRRRSSLLLAGRGAARSYVRYLANSLREAFDLPGVPMRFNLRKGDNPYAKHKR